MTSAELTNEDAAKMIEKLRSGLPADRFVSRYSTGNERFLNNVRKRHLDSGISTGKIRFVSGSWGAGKSHFLRLMAEQAFDSNYLVSNIEVRNEEVPFNRFERVFFGIVRVSLYPRVAQTNASAIPVLPLVGSTTSMPDFNSPLCSASQIIAAPMRHLTE